MKAKLVRRKTDDGLVEVEESVPLGTVYEILDGPYWMTMFNVEKGKVHTKPWWNVRRGDGPPGRMPCSLLEVMES